MPEMALVMALATWIGLSRAQRALSANMPLLKLHGASNQAYSCALGGASTSHHSGSGKREGLRCLEPCSDGSTPSGTSTLGAPRLCLPLVKSRFEWTLDCMAACLGPSLPYLLKAPGTTSLPCPHWVLPRSMSVPGLCLRHLPAAVPAKVAIKSVTHQKVFLFRFTRRGGGNAPSSLAWPSQDGTSDSVSDGMDIGASGNDDACAT